MSKVILILQHRSYINKKLIRAQLAHYSGSKWRQVKNGPPLSVFMTRTELSEGEVIDLVRVVMKEQLEEGIDGFIVKVV